jgi:hypothetical protein
MTAVQQVFSDLEKLQPHLFNMHSVEGREFVNHFHNFLAVEKEQIKDAWLNSLTKGDFNSADEYYNQTYKSEQQYKK